MRLARRTGRSFLQRRHWHKNNAKGASGAHMSLTGCNQPITYAPRSQATLVRNRIGDPRRATKEIGFTSEIDLDDGLRRLIRWRAEDKRRRDEDVTARLVR